VKTADTRGVGRDDIVLDENFIPKTEGRGRCLTEHGGIIREYYRDAASAANLIEDFALNHLQLNGILLRTLAARHATLRGIPL